MDDGFHHSVLTDLWRSIREGALGLDHQVFATTHSYECVRAAQQTFADSDDLAFFRLDRRDGGVQAVRMDAEQLQSALQFEMEIR